MKKKRIAWLIIIVALASVWWYYGVWIAAGMAAIVVVILAALKLHHVAAAHRGLAELRALAGRYHVPALQERLKTQDATNFTFVVLGDTRNNRRVASRLYQRAAAEKPALVFHTGDIVRHGTAREYLKNHVPLLDTLEPAPMFCVPGNHDRGARRDFAAFNTLHGGGRFALEHGSCLFVGFNNSTRVRVDEDDYRFVETALSGSGAPHKYVLMHIPPAFFEARIVNDDKRRGFQAGADELHKLFQAHGVDEVFMAHIHGYASEIIDGVRYTLTAGGGAPLSRRLPPEGRIHHYLTFRVSPQGVDRSLSRL